MALVADNSVIVAWFVKSQAAPYTWSILERAAAGEAIHVPLLWRQEFVNAMVVSGAVVTFERALVRPVSTLGGPV